MCLHIFHKYPCGTTTLHKVERCPESLSQTPVDLGPCRKKPRPIDGVRNYQATTIVLTNQPQAGPNNTKDDRDDRDTSESPNEPEPAGTAPPPPELRCNSARCQSCNTDLYTKHLRKEIREARYGPDWMADWYGQGDPDTFYPPGHPFLQAVRKAIAKQERILAEKTPRKFRKMDPKLWQAGACGLTVTRDGKSVPIETVDYDFRLAARDKVRSMRMMQARKEREQEREERERTEELEEKKAEAIDGEQKSSGGLKRKRKPHLKIDIAGLDSDLDILPFPSKPSAQVRAMLNKQYQEMGLGDAYYPEE